MEIQALLLYSGLNMDVCMCIYNHIYRLKQLPINLSKEIQQYKLLYEIIDTYRKPIINIGHFSDFIDIKRIDTYYWIENVMLRYINGGLC